MTLGDRSFAAIFQEIVGSIREIIRLEIKLAKTEVGESLSAARHGVVLLAASAFALLFATGFLLLSAVYALSLVMPPWAAALTVAGATAIVGGAGVAMGINKLKQVGVPARTIASLQESIQ